MSIKTLFRKEGNEVVGKSIVNKVAVSNSIAKQTAEEENKEREALVSKIRHDGSISLLGNTTKEEVLATIKFNEDTKKAKAELEAVKNKVRTANAQEIMYRQLFESAPRTTNDPVYHLPKQGYFIIFNKVNAGTEKMGRVFVKEATSNKWQGLMKSSVPVVNSPLVVVANTSGAGLTDLTEQEFFTLLGAKPTWQEITRAYCLVVNENVAIGDAELTVVW